MCVCVQNIGRASHSCKQVVQARRLCGESRHLIVPVHPCVFFCSITGMLRSQRERRHVLTASCPSDAVRDAVLAPVADGGHRARPRVEHSLHDTELRRHVDRVTQARQPVNNGLQRWK